MGTNRLAFLLFLLAVVALWMIHPTRRSWVRGLVREIHQEDPWASAGSLYNRAELAYTAGDFAAAEFLCERALWRSPRHAPATALLAELQFILGKGKITPYCANYEAFFKNHPVSPDGIVKEIDRSLASADQWMAMGKQEEAAREFRKVLEFGKWVPGSPAIDDRRRHALNGLVCLYIITAGHPGAGAR